MGYDRSRINADSRKCYMVSDSLCLTRFINVESDVDLVVIGQRDDDCCQRERGAAEAAWWLLGSWVGLGRSLKDITGSMEGFKGS